MPVVRLTLLIGLCALPCTAAGQTWADAVRAGDYQKAADLLRPIVISQTAATSFTDPAPARQLALLYAQGLGVASDPIAACTLAQVADLAAHTAPPESDVFAYNARLEESQQFARKHCAPLTNAQREAAGQSLGCFAFGMPETTLQLGSRTVEVGRSGIRLADGSRGPGLVNCPQMIARVRSVTIDPPSDAAPGVKPRHFIELLAWYVGIDPGTSSVGYLLQWWMYELRGDKLETVVTADFGTSTIWPNPVLPAGFDSRFTIEMIRSGHVRWRLDGVPPKRGWIMLPEERAR